jgi:hypothetical protein
MNIDPEKKRRLNEYLDDIFPEDVQKTNPFRRFVLHEIVRHDEIGTGIVTGFRIPDLKREFEGLGVQFVCQGCMGEHRVFAPRECRSIEGSGIEFDIRLHAGRTLEEIWSEAKETAGPEKTGG